jgi:hypothetical protein
LVLTASARRSFNIIARHKGFVFWFGFVLPFRARLRPHKLGVSAPAARFGTALEKRLSVATISIKRLTDLQHDMSIHSGA